LQLLPDTDAAVPRAVINVANASTFMFSKILAISKFWFISVAVSVSVLFLFFVRAAGWPVANVHFA